MSESKDELHRAQDEAAIQNLQARSVKVSVVKPRPRRKERKRWLEQLPESLPVPRRIRRKP